MNKEEKELVEGIKQYPTHRELCLIHVIERLDEELDKEKEKNKLALNYIRKEMYVDENPTICGDEDTITELPISLCLYNEELRELLNLLKE